MATVQQVADKVIELMGGEPNTEVEIIRYQEIEDRVREHMHRQQREDFLRDLPPVLYEWAPGQYKHLSNDVLVYIWKALHETQIDLPGGEQQYKELKEAIEAMKDKPFNWPKRKHFPHRFVIHRPGELRNTETRSPATPPDKIHASMTPLKANQRRRWYQEKLEYEKQLEAEGLTDFKQQQLEKKIAKLNDKLEDNHVIEAKQMLAQIDAEIDYQMQLRKIYNEILEKKDQELLQPVEKVKRDWGKLLDRIGLLKNEYYAKKGNRSALYWPPKTDDDFDHLVEVFGQGVLNNFRNSELPEKYKRTEEEEEKLNWIE